jgi:hypothetical protein
MRLAPPRRPEQARRGPTLGHAPAVTEDRVQRGGGQPAKRASRGPCGDRTRSRRAVVTQLLERSATSDLASPQIARGSQMDIRLTRNEVASSTCPPGPRASGCAHSGRRRRCRRRQPPIGIRERRRVRVRSSVAAASGCRNQQKQTVACQEQRTRSQRCLFAVETVHPCGRHPPHRQTAYNPTQGHHRGADQKATPPGPDFRFATRSCSRHAARGMSRENADRCSGASRHSTITTPPRFRRLARSGVELVPLALARRPFLRVGAERPVSAIAPGIGQRPACGS